MVRPLYRFSHDVLFYTREWNPFFKQNYGGKRIGSGHISAEHLEKPELDNALEQQFLQMGIPVEPYEIDKAGYLRYLERVNYPLSYYGGGKDPKANFTEKTLEHYVTTEIIPFKAETVFVDIAACTSPFYRIVQELYGSSQTYQQDLIFPRGIHGQQIGGWAHELLLDDNSVDAVTLHCSLEHFEGNSDIQFFQELARVLKPGGMAVILPFYLGYEYTIHVDPAFNLLKSHRPQLDPTAQLRYCNWYQYFSRHYDPEALDRRILQSAPALSLKLLRVQNFLDIDPSCYLRWIGVFVKS